MTIVKGLFWDITGTTYVAKVTCGLVYISSRDSIPTVLKRTISYLIYHLSITLSLPLGHPLSIYLFLFLSFSIPLSVSLFLYISHYPSLCLSISLYPSLCLCLSLSPSQLSSYSLLSLHQFKSSHSLLFVLFIDSPHPCYQSFVKLNNHFIDTNYH